MILVFERNSGALQYKKNNKELIYPSLKSVGLHRFLQSYTYIHGQKHVLKWLCSYILSTHVEIVSLWNRNTRLIQLTFLKEKICDLCIGLRTVVIVCKHQNLPFNSAQWGLNGWNFYFFSISDFWLWFLIIISNLIFGIFDFTKWYSFVWFGTKSQI